MDKSCCIVGGSGHVGYCLATQLIDNYRVINADLKPSNHPVLGVQFEQVDVLDQSSLISIFEGCDVIFHLASFGMSGKDMLNCNKTSQVNIDGTENVIAACLTSSVPVLVYASSVNVVFGGQTIENGDESLPYWPLEKHVDAYSRSKAIAEKLVLFSNNRKLANDGRLVTCALRFNGIYGPRDPRLPRIVSSIESGMFMVSFGQGASALTQYTSGQNCAQALRLAAENLNNCGSACGRAYFIVDGPPVDSFEMFKPLCLFLNQSYPSIRLPLLVMYYIAFLFELSYYVLHWISPNTQYEPLINRAEVLKMGVTHYFKIDRAKRDLGYIPAGAHSLDATIHYLRTLGYPKKTENNVIKGLAGLFNQIIIRLFVYGLIFYCLKIICFGGYKYF